MCNVLNYKTEGVSEQKAREYIVEKLIPKVKAQGEVILQPNNFDEDYFLNTVFRLCSSFGLCSKYECNTGNAVFWYSSK